MELKSFGDKTTKSNGAHCLGLQIINKNVKMPQKLLNFPQEAEEHILTLLIIVWNVWHKNSEIHSYISMFDLNQWYKEQMPSKSNQKFIKVFKN